MATKPQNPLRIVLFGAGNVASQLGKSLVAIGHGVVQVVGRSEENAKKLAGELQCDFSTDVNRVDRSADMFILAVPDSVIADIVKEIGPLQGLIVHTSGSTPMEVLSAVSPRHGVFYPFQTFSKHRDINLRDVPFCIEADNANDFAVLSELAKSLGGNPVEMDSRQRQMLHLAGVFSCNFVNHMLAISQMLAEENEFDFKLLKPLVVETIEKALAGNPLDAQTGPAVRGDSETIKKHVALLSRIDDDLRDLYLALSTSILNLKQSYE
ncbi:MAG: DUF2520 domain-containing protein [Tenuifilaceae bacterium]|jgi:predicted short-subunit dehydrogenase-like oxidoreductase (DUF2520 family)|nr:DUF2520 domain-containing protein [Tenuifilaceae bacterium]